MLKILKYKRKILFIHKQLANFSQKTDNIFTHLNERNLICNLSHDELKSENATDKMTKILGKNPKLYIGFDPTAEALHLGNLIGIITALRFDAYGINPVFLLGGATGQIGDPSGKNKERPLMDKEKLLVNLEKINQNITQTVNNIKASKEFINFKNIRYKHKSESESSSTDEEDRLLEERIKKEMKKDKSLSTITSMHLAGMAINVQENFDSSKKKFDSNGYKIVNNFDFYKDLNIVDFLREIGTNMRMGPLLSREMVKNRLQSNDGLSLAEFMYQTFQGYDFLKLFERYNVRIQIGGSDQWGNMLAGYELVKKVKNKEVVSMTFPLMTTANGQKFGKSEGNALFINPELTQINSIYQYFYNLPDDSILKLLNAFTFLETEEIVDIMKCSDNNPEKRIGQKILAEKVVSLLYSEEEALKCKANSIVHYNSLATKGQEEDLHLMLNNCNAMEISEEYIDNKLSISRLCVEQKIFENRRKCKDMIKQGVMSINNAKIEEDEIFLKREMLYCGKFLILKAGKKNTHVFQIKSLAKKEIVNTVKMESNTLSLS